MKLKLRKVSLSHFQGYRDLDGKLYMEKPFFFFLFVWELRELVKQKIKQGCGDERIKCRNV